MFSLRPMISHYNARAGRMSMGQIGLAFHVGSCSHIQAGDVMKVDLPDQFPHLQNGNLTSCPHRAVMRNRDNGNHRKCLAWSSC